MDLVTGTSQKHKKLQQENKGYNRFLVEFLIFLKKKVVKIKQSELAS